MGASTLNKKDLFVLHMREVKEDYATLVRDCEYYISQTESLQDENAKLRELCENMNRVAHMLCEAWEGSCSKEAEGMSLHAVCPIGDTSELCVFGKLHDRMRELGIEASHK